jgi:hypothetical protein
VFTPCEALGSHLISSYFSKCHHSSSIHGYGRAHVFTPCEALGSHLISSYFSKCHHSSSIHGYGWAHVFTPCEALGSHLLSSSSFFKCHDSSSIHGYGHKVFASGEGFGGGAGLNTTWDSPQLVSHMGPLFSHNSLP